MTMHQLELPMCELRIASTILSIEQEHARLLAAVEKKEYSGCCDVERMEIQWYDIPAGRGCQINYYLADGTFTQHQRIGTFEGHELNLSKGEVTA